MPNRSGGSEVGKWPLVSPVGLDFLLLFFIFHVLNIKTKRHSCVALVAELYIHHIWWVSKTKGCRPSYCRWRITWHSLWHFLFSTRENQWTSPCDLLLICSLLRIDIVELLVWSVECRWSDSTPIGRPLPHERSRLVRNDQIIVAHREILRRPFATWIPTLQQYVLNRLITVEFERLFNILDLFD